MGQKSVKAEVMGPTSDFKGAIVRADATEILAYFDGIETKGSCVDAAYI